MNFLHALAAVSVVFVIIERLKPRHRQGTFRKGILTDLFYLVFNGHFLGVGVAYVSSPLLVWLQAGLADKGWSALHASAAAEWPFALQLAVALVTVDITHWSIHNMLHRVPAFWVLHKVHHSIVHMDWIGSLRFHWSEVVIYKTITYPLLAFFGFGGDVLLAHAVVSVSIGHFNHANLDVSIGPLKYLFNNPEMHVWHHTHPDAGPPDRNFAINFSTWDWVFGTAYLPDQPPQRLGFDDIEHFPSTALGQLLHPLPIERFVRAWWRRRASHDS